VSKIVSIETLREERRKGEHRIAGYYLPPKSREGQEKIVESKIINGEMEVLELSKPLGEMITSSDAAEKLLRKVTLDVELGRAGVPTVYGPIYETFVDRNFPKVLDAKWAQYGVVVFLEHIEGKEVTFGALATEQGPTARIQTYAAGFEYTEDMVEYNQSWELEMLNRAFGEAYNALLNHIHLYPILIGPNADYHDPGYDAVRNQTAVVYKKFDGSDGTSSDYDRTLTIRATLKQALKDAANAGRPGSVLLANSANQIDLEDAMSRMVIGGTQYPALSGIYTIVYYDGWKIQVGKKTYTYQGVPTNRLYLIRPRRGFKELVKHDLIIDASQADLSRLIESQIVGRARRGVFAAVQENVQEIVLP